MSTYKGIVQQGTKRASKLGFPTINIPLQDAKISGIYAARIQIAGDTYTAAVFADPERGLLEAHVLGFSGAFNEKEITIELYEKIRESKQFVDDTLLRAEIASDIIKVRKYFKV